LCATIGGTRWRKKELKRGVSRQCDDEEAKKKKERER